MTDDGTFSVFLGRSPVGKVVVVYTSGAVENERTGDLNPFSEAFLFLIDSEVEALWKRFWLRAPSATEEAAEMLENVAREWADGELEEVLYSWRKEMDPKGPYPPGWNLVDVEPRGARLALRQRIGNEALDNMQRGTKCQSLYDYVEELLKLPDVSTEG